MKMEMEVAATCDGVVQEISINKGDQVEADDLLVNIE